MISDELLEYLAKRYIRFSNNKKELFTFAYYVDWYQERGHYEQLEYLANKYIEFSSYTKSMVSFVDYVQWCLLQDQVWRDKKRK